MNISKHPILKELHDLCVEVEKLPASEQQTKVITMLNEIVGEVELDLNQKRPEDHIRDFLKKIATQDNRLTAFPYFYVIRDVSYVCVGRDNDDVGNLAATSEDYDVIQYYSSDAAGLVSEKEYKELLPEVRYRLFVKKIWIEHGMFLTETDAKHHLERNYYHYSKEAHTYVKHAWRAPELKIFLKSLFEYFKIDYTAW